MMIESKIRYILLIIVGMILLFVFPTFGVFMIPNVVLGVAGLIGIVMGIVGLLVDYSEIKPKKIITHLEAMDLIADDMAKKSIKPNTRKESQK